MPKVQYITRLAPKRSERYPPTGRKRLAGKMKSAVRRAASCRGRPKTST